MWDLNPPHLASDVCPAYQGGECSVLSSRRQHLQAVIDGSGEQQAGLSELPAAFQEPEIDPKVPLLQDR